MNSCQKTITLVVSVAGVRVSAIQWSSLNSLLPEIQRDLHASLSQMKWIMNIYGVFVCASLVIWGHIADRYGHKKIYIFGLSLYIIACILAVLSDSPFEIIIAQSLIGLAGAGLGPVSQALLRNAWHNKQNRAIGIWASVIGICLAVGPLIGGVIGECLSWRWLFVFSLVFNIIALFLTYLFVEESKIAKKHEDNNIIVGGLLLAGGTFSFILGIDQFSTWPKWLVIFLFTISTIFYLSLWQIEKKSKQPIIDIKLIKDHNFISASAVNFCLFLCL